MNNWIECRYDKRTALIHNITRNAIFGGWGMRKGPYTVNQNNYKNNSFICV
jgi:hypothetical protein